MSFASHIARTMLSNGWQGLRSFMDTEPPVADDVKPADAYRLTVRWRSLAQHLEWDKFAWALDAHAGGSAEQVVAAWLAAVGLEPVPQPIGWALLLIDTALLMLWEGVAQSALPPPLEAYPRFDRSKASTRGAVHHQAWLPLALLMALNDEECASYTVFPYALVHHAFACPSRPTAPCRAFSSICVSSSSHSPHYITTPGPMHTPTAPPTALQSSLWQVQPACQLSLRVRSLPALHPLLSPHPAAALRQGPGAGRPALRLLGVAGHVQPRQRVFKLQEAKGTTLLLKVVLRGAGGAKPRGLRAQPASARAHVPTPVASPHAFSR